MVFFGFHRLGLAQHYLASLAARSITIILAVFVLQEVLCTERFIRLSVSAFHGADLPGSAVTAYFSVSCIQDELVPLCNGCCAEKHVQADVALDPPDWAYGRWDCSRSSFSGRLRATHLLFFNEAPVWLATCREWRWRLRMQCARGSSTTLV